MQSNGSRNDKNNIAIAQSTQKKLYAQTATIFSQKPSNKASAAAKIPSTTESIAVTTNSRVTVSMKDTLPKP